jgi:hypothetical protein
MRLVLLVSLLAATIAGRAQAASGQQAVVADLAAALERHPLVAIDEHHRSREQHAFLRALISDPAFVCKIDDIVVEFGSERSQALADRYIAGEDVPAADLRRLWRDTGQFMVWDSPVYAAFYETVRRVNQEKICDHPIRIVLGDPPVDWPAIGSAAEYTPFAERDLNYADVVDREVLARGHRALLLAGGMHLLKVSPGSRPGLVELLERRHPGVTYVVWVAAQAPGEAERLGLGSSPSLTPVADLKIDTVADLLPPGIMVQEVRNGEKVWVPMADAGGPPLSETIDAVLNLGTDATAVEPSPSIYLEPQYQAELRRRAAILKEVFGIDFAADLDAEIARAGVRGDASPSN